MPDIYSTKRYIVVDQRPGEPMRYFAMTSSGPEWDVDREHAKVYRREHAAISAAQAYGGMVMPFDVAVASKPLDLDYPDDLKTALCLVIDTAHGDYQTGRRRSGAELAKLLPPGTSIRDAHRRTLVWVYGHTCDNIKHRIADRNRTSAIGRAKQKEQGIYDDDD